MFGMNRFEKAAAFSNSSLLRCCVPGTAHVLRVSLHFPIMEVKASPKPSRAIASKFGMIFDSKQINRLQIPLQK